MKNSSHLRCMHGGKFQPLCDVPCHNPYCRFFESLVMHVCSLVIEVQVHKDRQAYVVSENGPLLSIDLP